jgi:hypothetical protein
MKKNDRKVDFKALVAALDTELTNEMLRAVAGGRAPVDTRNGTVEGITKCCWG